MAITETRVVQVPNDPEVINASNEAWRRWGWTVLNVQVTHSQDSKVTGGTTYYGEAYGVTINNVETTTINYVTITYQRDTGMTNYAQIAELQKEYDLVEITVKVELDKRIVEVETMGKELDEKPRPVIVTAILTVIGLWFWIIPGVIVVRNAIRRRQKWDDRNRQYGGYEQRVATYKRLKAELEADMESMIENERNRIIRERNRLLPA